MAQKRRKSRSRSRSKSKSKRKAKRTSKRPYKLDKESRARHKYRKRRHPRSRRTQHHGRMVAEAQLTNTLLEAIAKQSNPGIQPRHYTNDPEYAFSNDRTKEFKRGFPAPDVNFLRPQGAGLPPSRGNYPNWRVHAARRGFPNPVQFSSAPTSRLFP